MAMKNPENTEPAAAPADLVPLAELVAEGIADTIDALASRLDGAVFADDIGRRCCTRDTARELMAERERRLAQQREWQADRQRRAREQDERTGVLALRRRGIGVPVPDSVGTGTSAVALMVEPERERARDRKRTHLDEMLYGNDLTYRRVADEESES